MKVNIFTDISNSPTTENSGYAFYIGCRLGKMQKAGVLKIRTRRTEEAELHCIANAIYTLTRSKWSNLDGVVVHSDSKICIDLLNGKKTSQSTSLREVLQEINFLCMEFCLVHNLTIRDYKKLFKFTHVKAHTGKRDKLSLINNWCDKESRKYRLIADAQK